MNRPNPLSPDRMSARERLAEVCELLAFGAPHTGPPPGDVTGMKPDWWQD